jgi:hypothetical protein
MVRDGMAAASKKLSKADKDAPEGKVSLKEVQVKYRD